MMTMEMPPGAKRILDSLKRAGYKAYIVGGCVRDCLMGNIPKDWDICTDATPDEMMNVFEDEKIVATGLKHGTITICIGDDSYEVTTFRTDGIYSDNRRPETVSFVKSLAEDLARRDFTINAMAYNEDEGLVDLFGGKKDLSRKIIRCVGDPNERFKEDALRMLRALRFASRMGFKIDAETTAAIHTNKHLLANISAERIRNEMNGILTGCGTEDILIDFSDVICEIIPELKCCVGFEQNNPYHIYDVYTHSVKALSYATGLEKRWAMLLHDIGKPHCYSEKDGVGHFYGHPKKSREIAEVVLDRLKMNNKSKATILALVAYHDIQLDRGEKALKRALNKFGESLFRQLLTVIAADVRAQSHKGVERLIIARELWFLMDAILPTKPCFSLRDLKINGEDILEMGVPEGPRVGEVLRAVLNDVIEGRVENNKELLLNQAKKYIH